MASTPRWLIGSRIAASLSTGMPLLDRIAELLILVGCLGAVRRWRALVVVAVPALAYVFVISGQLVYFDRMALPLLVPLASLLAAGLDVVSRATPARQQRVAQWTLAAAAVAVVMVVGFRQWNESIRLGGFVDTRVRVEQWFVTHLKPDESIAVIDQLAWAPTVLKAHGTRVEVVDPWITPCWPSLRSTTYYLTNVPGPPTLRMQARWRGGPTLGAIPFLSPAVYVYRTDELPSEPCPRPSGRHRGSLPLARIGSGTHAVRDQTGHLSYELGFEGWMVSTELADGGGRTLEMRAELKPADVKLAPGDHIRLIIRAESRGQDICVSRIDLPRVEPIQFACPVAEDARLTYYLSHTIDSDMLATTGPLTIVLHDLEMTSNPSREGSKEE